jgi:hypothetical protein
MARSLTASNDHSLVRKRDRRDVDLAKTAAVQTDDSARHLLPLLT